MEAVRRVLAAVCLLALVAGCSITDHDGPLGRDGLPRPCDTASLDEAFGATDVRSWVLYTDHLARITVTSIDGGRHPSDGELAIVHFSVDEVYASRPGAPPIPAVADVDVLPCDVGTQWVDGRTYVAPLVRVARSGGPTHWVPIGRAGLMTYDDGVLGDHDRKPRDQGWGDAYAGRSPDDLAEALDAARAPYAAFAEALWLQPDPYLRVDALARRAAPKQLRPVVRRAERRAAAVLRAERPGVRITWVRRELDRRGVLDGRPLRESLAASTWTDALTVDGSVYVARVGGRDAWVVQRPGWAGLEEDLVVVLRPDGTSWRAVG